jgi:hypothetical protein
MAIKLGCFADAKHPFWSHVNNSRRDNQSSGHDPKYIVPGIIEMSKRRHAETGGRLLTKQEAWEIADKVWQIGPFDKKVEAIKHEMERICL